MNGGTVITLPSRPSDVALPPYARRLDVRATRAAFAAGTLGTVGDDPAREDAEGNVVARDANRDYPDGVQHQPIRMGRGLPFPVMPTDHEPREWYDEAERLRQSRLRRWQTPR